MDNYNKYLKYKNKYINLKLKYLNIFNEGDFSKEKSTTLNKKKYIELKNKIQLGGMPLEIKAKRPGQTDEEYAKEQAEIRAEMNRVHKERMAILKEKGADALKEYDILHRDDIFLTEYERNIAQREAAQREAAQREANGDNHKFMPLEIKAKRPGQTDEEYAKEQAEIRAEMNRVHKERMAILKEKGADALEEYDKLHRDDIFLTEYERNSAQHEAAQREAAQREAALREAVQRKAAQHEAALREANGDNRTFISSGSTGFAYTPPFECSKPCYEDKCTNGISKVMLPYYAKREYDIYQTLKLNKIDPEGKFYITNPHMCDPKVTPELARICTNNFKSYRCSMLIYENGGFDLYKFLNISPRFFQNKAITYDQHILYILMKLENIFHGVHLLNLNNIYHADVRTPNIVVGTKQLDFTHRIGDDKLFRLIDFGLAYKYTDRIEYNKILLWPNPTWPPETTYLLGQKVDMVKYIRSMFIEDGNVDGKVDGKVRNFYNMYIFDRTKDELTNITKIKENLETKFKTNTYAFLTALKKSIDIYSLGYILLEIAQKESIYKERIIRFLVESKLLYPDPFVRPNAENARRMYQYFLSTL